MFSPIEYYQEYDETIKRLCVTQSLYCFEFDLFTFEVCHNVFSDNIEVGNLGFIDQEDFYFHFFTFKRLCEKLNLECNQEIAFALLELYRYALHIINHFQESLKVCQNDRIGFVELSANDVQRLAIENKYKKNQQAEAHKNKCKFEHYFYEFFPDFSEQRTSTLKYIDSVRKNLFEMGDTIEGIKSRDLVISLLKHYEYLTKGVTIEQRK